MAKFKIGDRVKVIEIDGGSGAWLSDRVGKTGAVTEISENPDVNFDDGGRDWGSEDYLELVEENKLPGIHINIPVESLFVILGGKKYRLVEA